ncbi:MAG TPA: hypothetical protein VL197_11745 [Nitrospirota bacterium]|nr:hypothetical protein [Nitrospirota bacterium]
MPDWRLSAFYSSAGRNAENPAFFHFRPNPEAKGVSRGARRVYNQNPKVFHGKLFLIFSASSAPLREIFLPFCKEFDLLVTKTA